VNREELELETEHLNLMEALDEAKANYNGEEIGPSQKALKDAEWAVAEFNIKWRTVRDAFHPRDDAAAPDGVATPESVSVSTAVSEGN